MNKKEKAVIAYMGIIIIVIYFIVVTGYYLTESAFLFRLWEAMIIISAPVVLFVLISVLDYAGEGRNGWKTAAIAFMTCTMAITAIAHSSNVFFSQDVAADLLAAEFQPYESLAWGFFMGLAFICTFMSLSSGISQVTRIKHICMICGIFCLLGLLGPILDIAALWFVAVAGYGLGTPVICMCLLSLYKR